MSIDIRGLNILTQEALALGNKATLSKQEERRLATVLAGISSIKAGATLKEVDQERLNNEERTQGLRETRVHRPMFELSEEQRMWGTFAQRLIRAGGTRGAEFRDESEGAPMLTHVGTYSGLGYFVPTDFYDKKIFKAMAKHDPLFDLDGPCTVITSTNGSPMTLPGYDDISNVAVQINEAQDTTGDSADLGNPSQAVVGAYSFRSPISKFSMEVFDDIGTAGGALELFSAYASDRLARGIGKVLLTGAGSTTTLGLISSLEALGVTAITASGDAVNNGSGDTGANSIGTPDLADLYYSVNEAYRSSDSCGWLMNDSTLTFLTAMVDKQGHPIVKFYCNQAGEPIPYLLNKPIYVSPSMANIGSKTVPVIFGDLSFWVTRLVSDDKTRIRVLKETYILTGQYGLQAFMRADGALAFTGSAAHSPLNYIQCHS